MLLGNIHISNYKMFKDIIAVFTTPLTIITGSACTGKTTFLEITEEYCVDHNIKCSNLNTDSDDVNKIISGYWHMKLEHCGSTFTDNPRYNYEKTVRRCKKDIDILLNRNSFFNYMFKHAIENYNENYTTNGFNLALMSSSELAITKYILGLLSLGYKDQVILIDTPERDLPLMVQRIILNIYLNFAINNNCQIIMCSTSLSILASALDYAESVSILEMK